MDLTDYRNSQSERTRVGNLMGMLPIDGDLALDIGARDGYISKLLANQYSKVTALDLEQPAFSHERVECVKGDITKLQFTNDAFDMVFCAEVLEHIPPHLLATACRELARVSNKYVLVGVPFQQDIRVGRTTCSNCGKVNPPWGHVNRFDENKLSALFPGFTVTNRSFVGESGPQTNPLSCALMDLSGNPYGTYSQEEPCIHCGGKLGMPKDRKPWQKVLTKVAFAAQTLQNKFQKTHGNWIHLLLQK